MIITPNEWRMTNTNKKEPIGKVPSFFIIKKFRREIFRRDFEQF